jgi:ribonuclease P protein component
MSGADFSFPKEKRIIKKSDFDRIFAGSRPFSRNGLTLRCLRRALPGSAADGRDPARSDTQFSRLGMMIGRKAGGAVTRNRVRRLLREAFRTRAPQLPEGRDYLVTSYRPLAGVANGEITDTFVDLITSYRQ